MQNKVRRMVAEVAAEAQFRMSINEKGPEGDRSEFKVSLRQGEVRAPGIGRVMADGPLT